MFLLSRYVNFQTVLVELLAMDIIVLPFLVGIIVFVPVSSRNHGATIFT